MYTPTLAGFTGSAYPAFESQLGSSAQQALVCHVTVESVWQCSASHWSNNILVTSAGEAGSPPLVDTQNTAIHAPLGCNSHVSLSWLAQVLQENGGAIALQAGGTFCMALAAQGKVVVWGKIGVPAERQRGGPMVAEIMGLPPIISIAAGQSHALMTDGERVWALGRSDVLY